MEIRPGVYSYELEWAYDEPLGVHVLDTERATVLFGAGSEDTADQLTEIATAHDIDVAIVEHGDTDHYGGVPALRAATDDLDVAAPAGDVAALEAAGLEVDDPLTTDNIYWGITPIAAPGHTPDNMAYLYEEILVAGDTVVSADSPFAAAGTGAGRSQSSPQTTMPTTSRRATASRSLPSTGLRRSCSATVATSRRADTTRSRRSSRTSSDRKQHKVNPNRSGVRRLEPARKRTTCSHSGVREGRMSSRLPTGRL